MILTTLRATIDLENADSLLAKHTHNRVDQREDQGIGGGFGERQVKIEIRFDERIRIPFCFIHNADGLSHLLQTLLVGARGGKRRDLWFQNLAHFYEMRSAVGLAGLEHAIEGQAD